MIVVEVCYCKSLLEDLIEPLVLEFLESHLYILIQPLFILSMARPVVNISQTINYTQSNLASSHSPLLETLISPRSLLVRIWALAFNTYDHKHQQKDYKVRHNHTSINVNVHYTYTRRNYSCLAN